MKKFENNFQNDAIFFLSNILFYYKLNDYNQTHML